MRPLIHLIRILLLGPLLLCSAHLALAQNGDEAAPADQDLLETGQVEAAHSVQIPIVYTGGSKGIGSGTYHFNLPNQITESLAEKGD